MSKLSTTNDLRIIKAQQLKDCVLDREAVRRRMNMSIETLLLEGKKPVEILSIVPFSTHAKIARMRNILGLPLFQNGRPEGIEDKCKEALSYIESVAYLNPTVAFLAKQFKVSRQRIAQLLEPEKHKCRVRCFYAIRKKTLTRPNKCSFCLVECTPQAHHEDYSQPLDVVWLCARCHNLIPRSGWKWGGLVRKYVNKKACQVKA
jgi:hypothetical protein